MGNSDIQQKLDILVEAMREKFNVPSITVAVGVKGENYCAVSGLSDIEAEIKAQGNSVYGIASASKAFIATALCILMEEGKLDLDCPVKKYLPDFAMFDSYMTDHMTIKDALSHRTGLPRHDFTWFNAKSDSTIFDTVKSLAYLPPAYEPRYRMHYQNHMFALASAITEKVSGMPWQDFVKNRIFDPLGMSSTYATGDIFPEENTLKARPYKLIEGEHVRIPYRYLNNIGCCGSIYSTVEDLLKWAQFHLYGNENILSNTYRRLLQTPHTPIKAGDFSPTDLSPEVDMASYGLGWFIESYRDHKMVHHGGTIDGFKSTVGFLPNDEISFTVLSNLNGNQSPMAIGYAMIDMLLELEYVDWHKKIKTELDKQHDATVIKFEELKALCAEKETECSCLGDYAGEYHHPGYGSISFSLDNSKLYLNAIGAAFPVTYIGGEEFMPVSEKTPDNLQLYVPFYFERDDKNQVCTVNVYLEEKLKTPITFNKK